MQKFIVIAFALAFAAASAAAWSQNEHHDDKAKSHAGQSDGTKSDKHDTHGNTSNDRHGSTNLHSYRRNVTAPHRYHWGDYHKPTGWYAHRWVYGERLPPGWFGRDNWIGDYVNFGLIAPPDGYNWVRVGDDAVLVESDNGEVLEVEYGVFY